MTKKKLLEYGKLDLALDDFEFDAEFTIISYRVIAIMNGYNYEILNKGAAFSKQTVQLIRKLKPGQRIYFEDIKVKDPTGKIRQLQSFVVKLI